MQGKTETLVGLVVLAGIGIFVYMGFQIGAFRFDRNKYQPFTLTFTDISGLTRKADVKIAGVKVGWVDSIKLVTQEHDTRADVIVNVLRQYDLYQNAHAVVRQEGLLGPKYVEVVPGNPMLPPLQSGQMLAEPSVAPVSVDDVMQTVKKITTNLESLTNAFNESIGGARGEGQLREIFQNLDTTTKHMASFATVLDNSFVRNEDNLDAMLSLGQDIRRVAEKLDQQVLPSFQESIEKIATVFDRDFDRVATQLSSTTEALEEASLQVRDGFASVTAVSDKINDGKGLIGKLVNEDETYRDLKVAVEGIKNYFAQAALLEVVFDAHTESMLRPAEYYCFEDSKFYLDVKFFPAEDMFYTVQLATSEKGSIGRAEIHRDYCSRDGTRQIDPDQLNLSDIDKLRFVFNRKSTFIFRDTIRFGFQFGKIFKNIALRAGLFEGFGGVALDVDVPLHSDNVRWISSLEAFDFTGRNRIMDRRPHLKWLNKLYFMRNLYFTFGADDFISKNNANMFFGIGLRFGDDNIKYLLPSFAGLAGFARINEAARIAP